MHQLESVDHAKALAEDVEERRLTKSAPLRFGIPLQVNLGLSNSGQWDTLEDGSRLWRLTLKTTGAFSTNLIFKRFVLPYGASLHVIGTVSSSSSQQPKFLGAFTYENNKEEGVMATGPLPGDEFTLEYYEPRGLAQGLGELELETVVHAYRPIFASKQQQQDEDEKNGRSGLCNFNVVCPIGDDWRDQIRSVAALMTASGSRFCTGSMLNNHLKDGKQLFLSAAHCGNLGATTVALFNYQSFTCARGGDRFLNYTVAGFRPLARNTISDFQVAELVETIPEDYNVFMNGFNGVDEPDKGAVGIHHPMGDVKKISFSFVPTKNGSWTGGPANTHWRVEPWHNGTTEPGSSGSPLFDLNHRVVGQLHGGSASCSNMRGYDVYGKIAKSWELDLNKILDPTNTGRRQMDGIDLNSVKKIQKSSPCSKCFNNCRFFSHSVNKKATCDAYCLSSPICQ